MQRALQRGARGGLQVLEVENVLNPDRLQLQNDARQVAALDLGHRVLRQLQELALGEESEALRLTSHNHHYLARTLSTRSASALPRVRLGDGHDEERLESGGGLRDADLHHARVHHVLDAADGDGRLGDVGGENDLARVRRRGREHDKLLIGRQCGIQRVDLPLTRERGEYEQWVCVLGKQLHLLLEKKRERLDLLLAREEHEDVARRHVQVQLQHGDQRRLDVVRLGSGCVAKR